MGVYIEGEQLHPRFQTIRQTTESLCKPLAIEDYVVQAMEDVSPPKWHLAHTSWFFETFVLAPYCAQYKPFHPSFHSLFNSYYQAAGSPYPRAKRGLLSRPSVDLIYSYRAYVNEQMGALFNTLTPQTLQPLLFIIELGLHHEQQHQELLLMDIKYNFSMDPQFPGYYLNRATPSKKINAIKSLEFYEVDGGLVTIGHQDTQFCFDNELPAHQYFLHPYQMATRLVINAEYLEFIDAGGYDNPLYWLAEGWDLVQKQQWKAPLYWYKINQEWFVFTLSGLQQLNLDEPVCHVSYYEADAYARWKKARLPLESEWEHCVRIKNKEVQGNLLETQHYHPLPQSHDGEEQFFGDLWEWTSSAYSSYPGYQPFKGMMGEYNGKFMSNQMVLRGGSCVTPHNHLRASYRNFYQPDKRWPFTGIRLSRNGI